MPPRELREDGFGLLALAEETQRAREGLDGVQLEGSAVVDRIARDQEGQRAMQSVEVERLPLGGFPGAVERHQSVAADTRSDGVGGRKRLLGEGVEDDPRRRRSRRPVEVRQLEASELPGGTFLGVVVALVAHVQVHGRRFPRSVTHCSPRAGRYSPGRPRTESCRREVRSGVPCRRRGRR